MTKKKTKRRTKIRGWGLGVRDAASAELRRVKSEG
jgi:hypothetical protein